MRNLCLFASVMFLSMSIQSSCATNLGKGKDDGGKDDYDDDDEAPECHPNEADVCFNDVNENLLCHVLSRNGRNCTRRTAKDLCEGLGDALNCTSDVIDSGCIETDGRPVFDNWLAGLRGVQSRLCQKGDYDLLNDLLQGNKCWNFRSFIKCVESKANLTRISDLLTTDLDQHECNLLQMIVSVCNDKAEKNRVSCRGKADAVNEAVAAFFSSSKCAWTIPAICAATKTQECKTTPKSNTGMAVFVTTAVLILLMGLACFLLIKKDVITVNTKFRLPRRDVVEEAREDYGRFL